MTKILNSQQLPQIPAEDIIDQQQTMITALKQQILRLQQQVHSLEDQIVHKDQLYSDAIDEIDALKQKIDSLKENNQSLLQTLQVFQREFVKRDYKNALNISSKKEKATTDGPFFMELIRIMKSKFVQSPLQQVTIQQRSYLSEYYGYFFHSEVQENQAELFNEAKNQKKVRVSKIKSFGKKNYFNQKFRHFFWFYISENNLKITYRFYEKLLDKLDGNRENQNRGTNIIDLDLRRMDFKLNEEQSESMKVEIKKLLQLFCLYRPDIGYIQGMSYLAWMFLIRMENYQAFVCFTNVILCDPFVHSLYMFKEESIRKVVNFQNECLHDKKPKLAKYLQKMQVDTELYLIEWAYTFYSRAFSLRIISKIWDLWMTEGFNTFYKVSMTILEMLEGQILQEKENDRIIQIIRTKTHKLDEVQFLKILGKQKLYEDLKL